eukprot:TRINITY_DN4965_c0_g1_i1.p1 TRINITY_DN4965_c0_g1~~TRINITY_DN4965_c0_g1_i1.p1  ORF type:complete len:171 (-),score=46.13 TRINITY_DN4965_c0_g1_i1:873-1385(-)
MFIELQPADGLIREKLGKTDAFQHLKFTLYREDENTDPKSGDNIMTIAWTVNDKEHSAEIPLGELTPEAVKLALGDAAKDKVKFQVHLNLKGEDIVKAYFEDPSPMPQARRRRSKNNSWTYESGGGSGGSDFQQSKYYVEGPADEVEQVVSEIKSYLTSRLPEDMFRIER